MQRLSGWTQLLKRLIVQFEMVVDHQKRLAEAYGKCAKDFALPVRTREEEEIFGGDETTLVCDLLQLILVGKALTNDLRPTTVAIS